MEKNMFNQWKDDILIQLQETHIFFRTFTELNSIHFDEKIDTAQVSMHDVEEGNATLSINPTFYSSLTEQGKKFLICHELLHIILEHIPRYYKQFQKFGEKINIAQDIVINHMLVNLFNFSRDEIGDLSINGCWVDTVFPNKKILDNKSTEYYLQLLINSKEEVGGNLQFDTLNYPTTPTEAEEASSNQQDIREQTTEDIIDIIKQQEEEINDLKKHIIKDVQSQSEDKCAGTNVGGWERFNIHPPKIKKKWESVIKKWSAYKIKERVQVKYRWNKVDRRFGHLDRSKFALPAKAEKTIKDKQLGKIEVIFFLDVSGSCYHLKERFVKAARTLDTNIFNIHLFSFDVRTHPIDYKSMRIYGGGGTSFKCLDQTVNDVLSEQKKFKDYSVWVITDGYGDYINPKNPHKWNWFLTDDSTKNCIPIKSKIHKLKDYE